MPVDEFYETDFLRRTVNVVFIIIDPDELHTMAQRHNPVPCVPRGAAVVPLTPRQKTLLISELESRLLR